MKVKPCLLILSIFFLSYPIVMVHSNLYEVEKIVFITNIVDGDTFDINSGERVRLADIDAPEVNEEGYTEATEVLNSLVYWRKVYLDVDDLFTTDPYGRLVCLTFVEYNSTHLLNVNKYLVESGVASVDDYDNQFNPSTWVTYILKTQVTLETDSDKMTEHIVINEVEQNPSGRDEGNEWVELFNPTSSPVDIGKWKVSTTHGMTVTIEIPISTIIESEGYYVIMHDSQWLDNEDESVILQDSNTEEIDRTPIISDTHNSGSSWQRYPNGVDSDDEKDWTFKGKSRGASNGGEPVTKMYTEITCQLTPKIITTGESVSIHGKVNASITKPITILKSIDSGYTWSDIATIMSSKGSYSYDWEPGDEGIYLIRSGWTGDSSYYGDLSGTVTLTVVSQATGDLKVTVTDEQGSPLDGATVRSSSTPDHQRDIFGHTRDDGSITFFDLLGGNYFIEVSKMGYESISETFFIHQDETTSGYITMERLICNIRIYVNDQEGNPLQDVHIQSTLIPSGQVALGGTTAQDGSLVFNDVKPGSYTFEASKMDYSKDTASISISLGETLDINYVLEPMLKQDVDEKSGSGGIPGFPFESIVIGFLLGWILLLCARARSGRRCMSILNLMTMKLYTV